MIALAADGRVVRIESLQVEDLDRPLTEAAERFGLDAAALGAAARAALAAPDREIVLEVAPAGGSDARSEGAR